MSYGWPEDQVKSRESKKKTDWPDPTPQMLDNDKLFDAIWNAIKTWDINVPGVYSGYCGASGNHARHIYDAIRNIPETMKWRI